MCFDDGIFMLVVKCLKVDLLILDGLIINVSDLGMVLKLKFVRIGVLLL